VFAPATHIYIYLGAWSHPLAALAAVPFSSKSRAPATSPPSSSSQLLLQSPIRPFRSPSHFARPPIPPHSIRAPTQRTYPPALPAALSNGHIPHTGHCLPPRPTHTQATKGPGSPRAPTRGARTRPPRARTPHRPRPGPRTPPHAHPNPKTRQENGHLEIARPWLRCTRWPSKPPSWARTTWAEVCPA
jgi:hypothetical protein